ncbi:MAG: hypothetical protein IPG90_16280 [Bacteroidetes bacterium]|nr:hypothetical protein [Bacteroidota bacterium]
MLFDPEMTEMKYALEEMNSVDVCLQVKSAAFRTKTFFLIFLQKNQEKGLFFFLLFFLKNQKKRRKKKKHRGGKESINTNGMVKNFELIWWIMPFWS